MFEGVEPGMLIGLAIKALIFAAIPLALVYIARGSDRYRRLAWVTVFFTFDLIVFGAFTRLTDSGLGCPDWPGCYGEANLFLAHEEVGAAEAAQPSGPVTVVKAWIEMIHRYLAMGVGVLIIALLLIALRLWRRTGLSRYHPAMPLALLLWVCVQGAFGALTVTLKLQPVIVTIHLLLGMGLLSMLVWHATRQNESVVITDAAALVNTLGTCRWLASLAFVCSFVQIAFGGWVSTNYAALACGGFPLCQGAVMPPMDFEHGFTLWRQLGMTAGGEYLPFDALVAVHWVHRMFALVVVAIVGFTAWQAMRLAAVADLGRWLLGLIGLQFLSGISTVIFNWPLALAVLHNAGAALTVVLLTMLNCRIAIQAKSNEITAQPAVLTA
ncbi:MAG: COX15/CtaA family protein [Burkholderiaceae bacterium]